MLKCCKSCTLIPGCHNAILNLVNSPWVLYVRMAQTHNIQAKSHTCITKIVENIVKDNLTHAVAKLPFLFFICACCNFTQRFNPLWSPAACMHYLELVDLHPDSRDPVAVIAVCNELHRAPEKWQSPLPLSLSSLPLLTLGGQTDVSIA